MREILPAPLPPPLPHVTASSHAHTHHQEHPTPFAPQVVDFFRTVNKDAHLLTRMGSDGVQGCGGLVVRVFASCLRRLGLGNPGASVENMAFGTENPLDFSVKPGRSGSTGTEGEVGRGGPGFLSGEFVVGEEEELEEEDDADEEELSAQVGSQLYGVLFEGKLRGLIGRYVQ